LVRVVPALANTEAPISADGKWSELDKLPNSIIAPAAGTAMFTPPSADQEDLIVTLTATGEYVLKLEANDGELTGAGTITINVSEGACEAAKATPGFELLTGDICRQLAGGKLAVDCPFDCIYLQDMKSALYQYY
jgi:hypothetical protein